MPATPTGANDWLSISGGERRVGLVHALLNDVALTLYSASWLARCRGHHGKGAFLALAGFTVLGGAGWLGGHLTYALGIGSTRQRSSGCRRNGPTWRPSPKCSPTERPWSLRPERRYC